MKKRVIFVLTGLVLFGVGVYAATKLLSSDATASASWSEEKALSFVSDENTSGSGYRDLEGKTLAYKYEGFGSFQLAIYDNHIKWTGYDFGYFDGITAQVEPTISKVEDNIYFMSWNTGSGTDNVVINLDAGIVRAHLYASDDSASTYRAFDQIHGGILCGLNEICRFPDAEPSNALAFITAFSNNEEKHGLVPMADYDPEPADFHLAAQEELTSQRLVYAGSSGHVAVEVSGVDTKVKVGGKSEIYGTHVTKISDGIFLISWLNERTSGDNIVVNVRTKKVFDHVTSEGVRGEIVSDLICFDSVDNCKP